MSDKPTVKLTRTNGNVFLIIYRVIRTLKNAGQNDKARQFEALAFASPSYDAVLRLVNDYCEIS